MSTSFYVWWPVLERYEKVWLPEALLRALVDLGCKVVTT